MSAFEHPMAIARARLDDALVELRAVRDPAVPLRDAERAIADAIASAYRCLAAFADYAAWSEHNDRVRASMAEALEALQHAPTEDPAVDEATLLIASALRLIGAPSPLPVEAPLDLPHVSAGIAARATLGAPALITLSRGVMRPSIPLGELDEEQAVDEAPPAPAPDTDALMAEARAAIEALERDDDAPDIADKQPREAPPPSDANEVLFGLPAPYAAVIHERARECIEDLAALGAMRRPVPDEAWWCPRTEERLLARLDGLVACGVDALPPLVKLLDERPLPDPELTWALVFLFASIAGDDSLHSAERVLRCVDLTAAGMTASVADALSHAPHPGVTALLRSWVVDPAAPRRVVAAEALARRAALDWSAHEVLLADDDPDVRRAAAAALARCVTAPPWSAFERLIAVDDDAVVAAAMRASVLWRTDIGTRAAAALLDPGATRAHVDAAMTVAVSAGPEGFGLLLQGTQLDPRPHEVEALGWFGHLGAVRLLLSLLAHDDDDVKKSAATALWRLTGAPLTDDAPAPEYSDERPPFTRAFRAPERAAKLSADAGVWGRWWEQHGPHADLSRRYRFGHPWSLEDNFWELSDHASTRRARDWCHRELVARTGRSVAFDAEAFIVDQERCIAAARADLASRSAWQSLGAWPAPVAEGRSA